jgi:hypothetical protein
MVLSHQTIVICLEALQAFCVKSYQIQQQQDVDFPEADP